MDTVRANDLVMRIRSVLDRRAQQVGTPQFQEGVMRSLIYNILCGQPAQDAAEYLVRMTQQDIEKHGK